jgi:hypothetical protein
MHHVIPISTIYRLLFTYQQHKIPNSETGFQTAALSAIGNTWPKTGYAPLVSAKPRTETWPLDALDVTETAGYAMDVPLCTGCIISGLDGSRGGQLTSDESSTAAPIPQPCVQILGKRSFKCIYNRCESRFTRMADLKRHHADRHQRLVSFYCGFAGCRRAKRGFGRKDKRDDHERRVHLDP